MLSFLTATPLDVLYLRGNRLFGDAGHGECVMPPWPSVFAGALRSRILVDRGVSFTDFKSGRVPSEVRQVVGSSPREPGSFRVAHVGLISGGEAWFPAPVDLVAFPEADGAAGRLHAVPMTVVPRTGSLEALQGNFPLPGLPTLRTNRRGKPSGALWISSRGLVAHLAGEPVPSECLREAGSLWRHESRLGIALSRDTRTARESLLYSTETACLGCDTTFLVGVVGAGELLPCDGLVRLGGDGRGAALSPWEAPLAGAPWTCAPSGARFRLVLATPGLFPDGWLPPCVTKVGDEHRLSWRGLEARLVAAAVPRHDVVSGWDLAEARPKPAQRIVPRGAVYWFERTAGDVASLLQLREEGLAPMIEDRMAGESDDERLAWRRRAAEGFNNVWLGNWA